MHSRLSCAPTRPQGILRYAPCCHRPMLRRASFGAPSRPEVSCSCSSAPLLVRRLRADNNVQDWSPRTWRLTLFPSFDNKWSCFPLINQQSLYILFRRSAASCNGAPAQRRGAGGGLCDGSRRRGAPRRSRVGRLGLGAAVQSRGLLPEGTPDLFIHLHCPNVHANADLLCFSIPSYL